MLYYIAGMNRYYEHLYLHAGGFMYQPKPIDTSHVKVPEELHALIEKLAENNHDIWAAQRIKEGWTYGSKRDDGKKEHPDLIPYNDLPESEKEYDRNSAKETIKAVMALGYMFSKEN
jgi:hypothetical protein